MEFTSPDGLSSSYRSRVMKVQRDAIHADHQKEQKYLNKCETVCGRAQRKDEVHFRRKLEKLETERSRLDVRPSNESMRSSACSLSLKKSQELSHSTRLASSHNLQTRTPSGRDLSKLKELEKQRTRSIRQLAEEFKNMPEDTGTALRRSSVDIQDSGSKGKVSFREPKGASGGRRMSVQEGQSNFQKTRERRQSLPANIKAKKEPTVDTDIPSIILTEEQESASVLLLSPNKKPGLGTIKLQNMLKSENLVTQPIRIQDELDLRSFSDLSKFKSFMVPSPELPEQIKSNLNLKQRRSSRQIDQPNRKSSDSLDSRRSSLSRSDKDHQVDDINSLFEFAIQTVASADEGSFTSLASSRVSNTTFSPRSSKSKIPDVDVKQLDLSSLKELEKLLQDAKQFQERKTIEEEQLGHLSHKSRVQKRRLEFLETIFNSLNPNSTVKFDPKEMLECSYLRLSKSNIETLENMIRQAGTDPGIHAHSDVTDYDIWKGLKEERKEYPPPKKPPSKEKIVKAKPSDPNQKRV